MNIARLLKPKTWIIIGATISLGIVLIFAVNQAESAFEESLESIKNQHKASVSVLVSSALENRKNEMISLSHILRSSEEVSNLFADSQVLQNWEQLAKHFESIRDNTGLDWVGLLDLEGKPIFNKNLPVINSTQATIDVIKNNEKTLVFNRKGMLFLTIVSVFKISETPVGLLILGQNLNYMASENLGPLTKTRIRFSLSQPKNQIESITQYFPISLGPNREGPTVFAKIDVLDPPEDLAGTNLGLKLIGICSACLVFMAFVFHFLLEKGFVNPFHIILKELKDKTRKESEKEKALALSSLASKVSHDVRSPLAAIEIALKLSPEVPEDKRQLVRGAVSRIRDIANSLGHYSIEKTAPLVPEDLSKIDTSPTESSIANNEKLMQWHLDNLNSMPKGQS